MTDFTEAAREAAENHVIHVSNISYQCPACAEETLWKAGEEDFIAGAEFGRKRMLDAVLKELRSEGAQYETWVISGNAWADWLEARIQEIEGKK